MSGVAQAPGRKRAGQRDEGPVAGQAGLGFGGLLRRLRDDAGLTQEELAEAARVSQRAVSDLERGINRTARKDTALLLAGALGLDGQSRDLFVAAARGRGTVEAVLAARPGTPPGAFAAAATRALPRDIAAFTGRGAELARLMAALDGPSASGGVVGIHAIDGMAGIGKTSFAVHAAHRLAGRFPDGQFFLPLHAHTAGQRPVDPADGLASLLLAAAADRMALLQAENLSVTAAFDLSYQDLTEDLRRLFRPLGLIPGPSFDAYVAAALNGTSLVASRSSLMSCMTRT